MIARLDHRPMLTAALALSTTVLAVVVVALLIALLTLRSPASDGAGGGPAAHPVSGPRSSEEVATPQMSLERHARVVAAYTD